MDKRKRAAWREPPRRTGKIEPAAGPLWIELLEQFAPWGCGLVAAVTLAVGALAYADGLRGGL